MRYFALGSAIVLAGALSFAEPPPPAPKRSVKNTVKNTVKGTVKEAARTGGRTARDGAVTFGRSTEAFFTEGPSAARKTWKANAAKTKRTAKQGAAATKAAAEH